MDNPQETAGDGRRPDGTWAKGNTAGRGNPHARKVHALKSAALAAVSPEDMSGIIRRLVVQALGGDVAASKLVLEYTLGKAPATVALTGADGESLGMDWARVEGAVLAALAPFGDGARFSVALALRGLVDAGRAEQPGDEA